MLKDHRRPWLLLVPVILIMGIFVFYPIIQTFYYSLHQFKLTRPNQIEFIGLKNYLQVLNSPAFHKALRNSLFVLSLVILIVMVLSIAIGLLLNVKSRINPFLTAIAIIPWALPPLVNGIIWSFIFHPSSGMVNKILYSLNLIEDPINWTQDTNTLLMIVALIVAWRVIPFCAIIILANLQAIPANLYEASAMDGASPLTTFFNVTLPLLVPALLISLTQATLAGLNVFDEIVALVDYRQDAQTLLIYNYQNTFSFLDFGLGSAITYIIMIISGIPGYFYVRNMAKDM